MHNSTERFDWLNSSNTVFDKKRMVPGAVVTHNYGKSSSGRLPMYGANESSPRYNRRDDDPNNQTVSALKLHLMGVTKRTFFTRKEVAEFLNKTE